MSHAVWYLIISIIAYSNGVSGFKAGQYQDQQSCIAAGNAAQNAINERYVSFTKWVCVPDRSYTGHD